MSVLAGEDAIDRGASRRASALTITALCTDEEIRKAMGELVSWADERVSLVEEQWAWYVALGRPRCDEAKVVEGLHAMLACHGGLDCTLRRFESANDAWASANEAWAAARRRRDADANANGRCAGCAAQDGDSWWPDWPDDEANWSCEEWAMVQDALGAWSAQWDRWQPWDVFVANGVKDALIYYSAVSQGWLSNCEANHLTVGIRDAYHHGLAIAVSTGPSELGYAMDR